jgi:hypothetical protein
MLGAIELYKSFLSDPIVLQKFVQTRVHATEKIEQVCTFDDVSGADIDCPSTSRSTRRRCIRGYKKDIPEFVQQGLKSESNISSEVYCPRI